MGSKESETPGNSTGKQTATETEKKNKKETDQKRKKLSENFYQDEFACKCGCGDDKVERRLVSLLQDCREEFGFPMRLTSSKRCAEHNRAVGGVEHSAHLYGYASDIYCKDPHLRYRLLPILFSKFKRIGVYEDFFHVDVDHMKPNPVCW